MDTVVTRPSMDVSIPLQQNTSPDIDRSIRCKERAIFPTITIALGLLAGLIGFSVVGPFITQHMTTQGHDHSLGKAFMPAVALPGRGRLARLPWLSPGATAPPAMRSPPAIMQATAADKLEKDATIDGKAKANSWQVRLDKALLNIDVPPGQRLRLLERALRDPNLPKDVRSAVTSIQEKGFKDGHPEFIEKLWPAGTISRGDLEGLFALRRQVPEAVEDLRNQAPESRESLPSGPDAPDLPTLLGDLAKLATDKEKQKELTEEAKDAFRRTPKTLETPKYNVVRVIDGPVFLGKPEPIEIRAYEEFTVARTRMQGGVDSTSSGATSSFGQGSGAKGFNTLASYLFGKNGAKQAMAMTMPVEITSSDGGEDASMSFVLPRKFSEEPPAPLQDSGVTVNTVPARLVAAKAFAGIVTAKEVERQKAMLFDALEADGKAVPVDRGQVSVLQYNSPITIPWRRRNEVAIVVTEKDTVASRYGLEDEPESKPAVGPGAVIEKATVASRDGSEDELGSKPEVEPAAVTEKAAVASRDDSEDELGSTPEVEPVEKTGDEPAEKLEEQ